MTAGFNPEQLWKSKRALRDAREGALAFARAKMAKRAAPPAQVFSDYISGDPHLEFFARELQPIAERLPDGAIALEAGAGMCWHATLLTAHSKACVVATELDWGAKSPLSIENTHALYRLAEREPKLNEVLSFDRTSAGDLSRMHVEPRLKLVRASAHELPLRTASMDLVYSVNCLEHIPDLRAYFSESERVLKPGGIFYNATEPLYYSAFGHHLQEIFPLPWGHLLWPAEDFAEIIVREAGAGREWAPGEPLTIGHILQVQTELNRASPAEIRRGLRRGSWRVDAWLDLLSNEFESIAGDLQLASALNVPREWLILQGLRFRLAKTGQRRFLPTLWLPSHWRRRLRRRPT